MELYPLGDSAIVVQLGTTIGMETHAKIRALIAYLDEYPPIGIVEYVPAFTTVTIFYSPLVYTYVAIEQKLKQLLQHVDGGINTPGKIVEIPVCYGGEFGEDIAEVANHNGISIDEVIALHTNGEYLVHMIGFAPGFPYLGGLSQKIATPRRSSPRLSIPAGTVGIAGEQTGVYPIETPGGWRLIGRTPISLFRPLESPPSLLAAGDIVHFRAISKEEYVQLSERGDSL